MSITPMHALIDLATTVTEQRPLALLFLWRRSVDLRLSASVIRPLQRSSLRCMLASWRCEAAIAGGKDCVCNLGNRTLTRARAWVIGKENAVLGTLAQSVRRQVNRIGLGKMHSRRPKLCDQSTRSECRILVRTPFIRVLSTKSMMQKHAN